MASFESKAVKQSITPQEVQKFSLQRLEISVKKFIKVITIDMDRLQQHRLNVEKFNRISDWNALHRENINATRTVQQIKANIKEIKKLRNQVLEEDIEKFDDRTEPMVQQAIQTLQDFSLTELNSMVHEFSSAVKTQQETIDRIEDNIDKAHSEVQKGAFELGKASKFKTAVFPIAGAVIGTVVAGPVGLFAGAKIGAALGLGIGGTAGFFGGKYLKNRQNKVTEVEMRNLSVKKSSSLPDLQAASQSTQKKESWFSLR
uniref:Syntaxin-17 n=1 Tax=Magallana gigas TaxID=29159 RepID=K1QLT0_MAGGI